MTSHLLTHPWLLLVLFAAVIFTLDAVLARVADRWFGPPARVPPAGAAIAPVAPVRAEDMGVEFVGADWDVEAAEYFTEWSR